MAGVPPSGSSSPLSSLDDSSSTLTVFSRSPTPPEYIYPTPPSSQISAYSSPSPESSMVDGPGRPAKRRRLDPAMASDPTHLDVADFKCPPSEEHGEQVTRLFKALRNKRKIVVVAGAGISVSAGIPDFRSSSGLFKSLKKEHNLKGSGKDLFDAAVYSDADAITSFHQMVRTLSQQTRAARPTPFHHFLARLASEGRLQRLYTQNVDGIDASMEPLQTAVPLPVKGPWPKTVQLHGGLEKMVCIKCKALDKFEPDLFEGPVPPECSQCQDKDFLRTQIAGKRSHGVGTLRPRMVLYNEHNPDDEAIGRVTRADLKTRPDCVLVVGTSLKVPGVRRIVREMCATVNNRRDGLTVWMNNDPVPSGKDLEDIFDIVVLGPCDKVAQHANLGNWDDEDSSPSDVITEEEMAQAKRRGSATVVIGGNKKTPTKLRPLTFAGDASPLTPAKNRPLTYAGRASPITPAYQIVFEDMPPLALPPSFRGVEYTFAEHLSEESFSSQDESRSCKETAVPQVSEEPLVVRPKATSKAKQQATLAPTNALAPKAKRTNSKRKSAGTAKSNKKNAQPQQNNVAITSMLPVSKAASVTAPLQDRKQPMKEEPTSSSSQYLHPVSPSDPRNNYSPPHSSPPQPQLLEAGERGRIHEINLPRIGELDKCRSPSLPTQQASQSPPQGFWSMLPKWSSPWSQTRPKQGEFA